ncbi:alpha/beta hydrolase [Candidatus Saccharibacteria bacterium]|jgi:pimeloyl-ACP methyl ester carboxylesterase|nr:alpha/beta hydrolase [Candidatus Saccharibacteria bacterium]
MKKIYALHGWSYSTDKWESLLNEMASRNVDIEIIKIPGLTAPLKKVWNIDDYLTWLDEILPKEDVTLLGHSNGGRLALNFAWVYPDRVKKLILIDSAGVPDRGLARAKRIVFKVVAKVGKRVVESPLAKKSLYKLARVHDYNDASEMMKKVMTNMLVSDRSLDLSEIKTPTQIIWGADDSITPLRDGVHMKHELENARFSVVEGARHSPHFTHVHQVADLIFEAL